MEITYQKRGGVNKNIAPDHLEYIYCHNDPDELDLRAQLESTRDFQALN